MTGTLVDADGPMPFVVPAHPTVRNWPAGLMAHFLNEDDVRWTDGPWKSLVGVAEKSGWTVKVYVARGFSPTAVGKVGPLTDSLSLRCWRTTSDGVERAVAMWTRATWPVLGRGRATDDEVEERQGEGRKTTEGKTWLWHPPLAHPGVEVIPWHPPMKTPAKDIVKDPLLTKWTSFGCWTWVAGQPISVVKSPQFREWLKRIPGT